MQAGKLNRQITIQEKTIAADGFGQEIETWSTAFKTWASVTTTGGGEFYAAQKLYAETTALFKVRYTDKITPLNRIVFNNKMYEILYVDDVNAMRKELNIACKEVD